MKKLIYNTIEHINKTLYVVNFSKNAYYILKVDIKNVNIQISKGM